MRKIIKSKWQRAGLTGIFVLLASLFFTATTALAYDAYDVPADNKKILAFLDKFSSVLHPVNFIFYFLRQIGWNLIKLIGYFVDSLSNTFSKIATMDRFYSSGPVKDFIGGFKPYYPLILAVVLSGIGLFMILGFRIKGGEALRNFAVMALIVMALPFLMNKMYDVVDAYLKNGSTKMQTGSQTILTNISDVYMYAHDDFAHKKPKKTLGPVTVDQIDITEIADPDTVKNLAKKKGKYFNYKKVNEVTDKGNYKDVAVEKDGIAGWMKFMSSIFGDYYYRYTWHPFIIIFTLIANGLVLLLSMFKVAGISIDLAFNQLLALVLSFMDFKYQKFRRVIEHIFASIASIIAISVVITLFTLYVSFINQQSISAIGRVIATLAGAYFAINGPDMMVRLFGVDAGIKSGWGLMGGFLGLKKGAELGGRFLKKAGNTMSAIAGAVAGASSLGNKTSSATSAGSGLLHGKNGKMNSPEIGKDAKAEIGEPKSPVYGNTPGDGNEDRSGDGGEKLKNKDNEEVSNRSDQENQDGSGKDDEKEQDQLKAGKEAVAGRPTSPVQSADKKDQKEKDQNDKPIKDQNKDTKDQKGRKLTSTNAKKGVGIASSNHTKKSPSGAKRSPIYGNQQKTSKLNNGENQSAKKKAHSLAVGQPTSPVQAGKGEQNKDQRKSSASVRSSNQNQPMNKEKTEESPIASVSQKGEEKSQNKAQEASQVGSRKPNSAQSSPVLAKQSESSSINSKIPTKNGHSTAPTSVNKMAKSTPASQLNNLSGASGTKQRTAQSSNEQTVASPSTNHPPMNHPLQSVENREAATTDAKSDKSPASVAMKNTGGHSTFSPRHVVSSNERSSSDGKETVSPTSTFNTPKSDFKSPTSTGIGPEASPVPIEHQNRGSDSSNHGKSDHQPQMPKFDSLRSEGSEPLHAEMPLQHPLRDRAKQAIRHRISNSSFAKSARSGYQFGKQMRQASEHNIQARQWNRQAKQHNAAIRKGGKKR